MQQAERQAWAMHDPKRITQEQQRFQARIRSVDRLQEAVDTVREFREYLAARAERG